VSMSVIRLEEFNANLYDFLKFIDIN